MCFEYTYKSSESKYTNARFVLKKDGKMRKDFRRSSLLTQDISKYHHFVLESNGLLALCLTLLHIIDFSLHFVDIFIENLLSKK